MEMKKGHSIDVPYRISRTLFSHVNSMQSMIPKDQKKINKTLLIADLDTQGATLTLTHREPHWPWHMELHWPWHTGCDTDLDTQGATLTLTHRELHWPWHTGSYTDLDTQGATLTLTHWEWHWPWHTGSHTAQTLPSHSSAAWQCRYAPDPAPRCCPRHTWGNTGTAGPETHWQHKLLLS